ncbi:pleckstrin homology domain-containing family H member 1 [Clupea harengus]|uniref:Pleckstrin homology domain-containing family H member 1 n=1 Tax=Clupea harengus TaxID=7950 RepID=A0A6P8GBE5_CLUHA|nr:pleckstrin homology domain-containing family H member 1 [Clupea harengus]
MADVLDTGATGAAGAAATTSTAGGNVDWQKRCITLEMQLLRFRLQAGKIRELLAEKMQELEIRVTEADQRAETAEKQVRLMEEKLKSANVQPSESENSLCLRLQELTNLVQDRDGVIKQLEAQLEKQNMLRAQEAKIIEEKASKIKDWVTFKLREMEMENQQLKLANLKQAEQILNLQDKLQLLQEGPSSPTAPLSPSLDAHLVPSSPLYPPSCPGTPPALEEGWRHTPSGGSATEAKKKALEVTDSSSPVDKMTASKMADSATQGRGRGVVSASPSTATAVDPPSRDHSSDELNSKFRLQRLRSSSSTSSSSTSSSSSSAYENPQAALLLLPVEAPAAALAGPLRTAVGTSFSLPVGTSMTLPKVRTPLSPRDSIQLLKKHQSQPQPGLERFHQVNVSIDIGAGVPLLARSLSQGPTAAAVAPPQVEETDIDDGMEGVEEGAQAEAMQPRAGGPVSIGLVKECLDPDAVKPPTPPLHRFPAWESRIYAVAKSGMRVSEASAGAKGAASSLSQYPAVGPFTHLMCKNISVPVYTTLKGKATQISSSPLVEDDSGSEDDTSSLGSLRSSTLGLDRKGSTPSSPRALKRGVSVSSISSESDYAIPPDACSLDSDYLEPEHKVQRTSAYSCESTGPEMLEKSGYLLKMGSQVKAWKRRWFTLRNGEILYYKSPSDVIRKPQGHVELNASCCIARGEGGQTFQLITDKKTFYLTADSPNILEEWIRVLQNVLKVQATTPVSMETAVKPTVRGWLTKVKHGHSKMVWCALIGKVFHYYRNQDDKFPLGQLRLREARVEEVDRSCDSDEDYEVGGRGFLSSHCTLVVHPKDQSPTYLLIGTKQEKDTWLYHLTVAAGSSASLKVGTEYERLIGKLLDMDGDADAELWKRQVLCFSKDGLRSPLTTLPSEALQTEALKLFKSCQLFINVLVESPSIDYHTSLAQNALQVCLTHPELQNEMYCQLMKQTNCRTPNNYSLTQCWQLLSVCVALFLPQQHFLWYLKQHLHRHGDPRTEVGKYAVYCQRSVERTQQNGEREAKPSRMEIVSILLRNPYHHSLPFSIPVHFLNNTYQVVGFDGSTTVEEFVRMLNQRAGMRSTQLSGFALFTDDPSASELEHCLQPHAKICDIISKWEQALKELNPGKYEGTRIVRLTYKSRLCFRAQAKGETERERLLLAYQVNEEVQQGHFPVNKELALEVAALMAQVEYSDVAPSTSTSGSVQPKGQQLVSQALERFYPKRYKQDLSLEQLRQLCERLSSKWALLRGCSAAECVRIYLTVARKWPLFGAKLFSAKPVPPSSTTDQSQVWLAVSEDGLSVLDYTMHLQVTYPYQPIITFGGFRDDFMVVVSQTKDQAQAKKTVDKFIFAMSKPKILELTLLMASYINYWSSAPPSTSSPASAPGVSLGPRSDRKLWNMDSRHFPAMTYNTKGPTLL